MSEANMLMENTNRTVTRMVTSVNCRLARRAIAKPNIPADRAVNKIENILIRKLRLVSSSSNVHGIPS
jgi:hypothetical protein